MTRVITGRAASHVLADTQARLNTNPIPLLFCQKRVMLRLCNGRRAPESNSFRDGAKEPVTMEATPFMPFCHDASTR